MANIQLTEERLRLIINAAPHAILVIDEDSNIVLASAAIERMFGYQSQELLGQSAEMLIPNFQISSYSAAVGVGHILVGLRKNGSQFSLEMRLSPLMEESPRLFLIDVIDLQDWQRAEESSKLASIVESSEDAIISKNLDGIVQTWNRSAERLFGYSADQIIGRSVTLLIPPDRQHEESEILRKIKSDEKVESYETTRLRKDLTEIDVLLTVSPIKDASGNIVGASKIVRDISDRKIAYEEKAKLAAIVDSSQDAIIGKNLDGIVQTWNRSAERLFGYSADEIVGRSVTMLIPANYQHEESEILRKIRSGEKVESYETTRLRKDLTEIDVSLTISPIKDASGKVIGASKIVRDISDRKQREADARRLELLEQREEFMATLTHDLKNPLIGANRILELLAEQTIGAISKEQAKILLQLRDGNKLLLSMIQNLIEVYRFEKDAHAVYLDNTNLLNIVISCLDDIAPIAVNREIEIATNFPDGIKNVVADANAIRRVMQNLLDNALKFTPAGGKIALALKPVNGSVAIEITNTGSGISPDDQKLLFQRFSQAPIGKKYTPGTGLGLFLCKQIVDAHQGKITCSSAEGSDTTFRVELRTVA